MSVMTLGKIKGKTRGIRILDARGVIIPIN